MDEGKAEKLVYQKMAQKLGLIFSKSRYPFELGKLYKSPSSGWLIRFKVYSLSKQKLVRKDALVKGKTAAEKKQYASWLKKQIDEILKKGVYTDPVKQVKDPVKKLKEDIKKFPLVVALDSYMQEKRLTLKKQSVDTYEKWTRYFLDFLEQKEYLKIALHDFGPEHAAELRAYALETQKLGNKSFNTYKAFVAGFFIWAKPGYKLTSNPISETLKNLPTKTSKHLAYSAQQIADYKKFCEELGYHDLWFFVRLIYYTFCRPNEEARNMQVGDIKDDHIIIYAENSKTDHRSIMIPSALEEVFTEHNIRNLPPHFYLFSHGKPGSKSVGRTYMYDKHVKVLKAMGIEKGKGYDIYGWKHTGAIALYRATKDLMLVKEQCGHSDVSQTVEYLRDLGVFHYSQGINQFPAI